MTIHLITDHKGEVFGIYGDRKLIFQKTGLKVDEILDLLRIRNHIIVFTEVEMKEAVSLPRNLDDLEITGLLNEAATIATVEGNAKKKEKKSMTLYDKSKPAIRKVDDDKYELIWNVHEQVLCVSELTDDEFAEMIDHLLHMISLPRGAHRQAEIIYHFPTMNARTIG